MSSMRKDSYGVRTYKNKVGKVFFIHENSIGLKYSVLTRVDNFPDLCRVYSCGTLKACKKFCDDYKEA